MNKANGEPFELEVDPSFTVDKVKQALVEQGGPGMGDPDKISIFMQGPPEQHHVDKGGNVDYQGVNMVNLNGDQTLHELGINAANPSGPQGQPLLINPVFVKDHCGNILPVMITPSMPVEELKVQIQNATGIAPAEQSIIYEPHSIVDGLPDGQPLSAFGVPADGNAMLSLNPNRLKFNVKTGNGDIVPIDVDMTDPIDKVKQKVMDKTGTPVAEQKIYFNGEELIDGDMIDHDITAGSTLLMNPIMMQPADGKPFPLDVSFSDNVGDVKAKIAQQIPSGDIGRNNIVFRGQNLDNAKTLASYGVGDKSENVSTSHSGAGPAADRTLYLDPKPIQLSIIGPDGAVYPLTVDKTWTIDQVKQEITQKSAVAIPDQHLMVIDGGETRELQMGTSLLDNGMVEDMTIYLNPKDIRLFVKLPNGKAISAVLNTADTPYVVRSKIEPLAKMGSLEGATLIYGVEEIGEDKCLAEFDVAPESTIRMTMGTAKGADGKKWDVDAGNYVRGAAGDIKVDYGKSGIAPPSSKIGDQKGLNKLKGAADVIKVKNMMEKMQAQLEEDEKGGAESEEEKAQRMAASKQRKLSMMRHAALTAKNEDTPQVNTEKKEIAAEENVDENDLSYKYTVCLMKCCPCLRPETEEEIEKKNERQFAAAKKAQVK